MRWSETLGGQAQGHYRGSLQKISIVPRTSTAFAVLAYGAPGFSAMVALFTISNLLQFTLGTWLVDHHARFGKLLRNPMVWSTVLGFAFALTHPPLPEWGSVAIKLVGDALIPMMLLSLGVRLYEVHLPEQVIDGVRKR